MKAEQARAYEAMKGQFEGLLGRLQVSESLTMVILKVFHHARDSAFIRRVERSEGTAP